MPITASPAKRTRITAVVNPQRKRSKSSGAPRRNPSTILLGYLNPEKKTVKKQTTKKQIRRQVKRNPIQAKASTGRKPWKFNGGRKHHSRRKNPTAMPGVLGKPVELLKAGAIGAIAYFATRQVPQAVLKGKNTSWIGYLANLVTALASAGLADRYFGGMAGQAAFVGGGMYLFSRVLNDQTPYGKALNLQGLGDPAARGLGAIVPGYWAQPPVVQRDGTPVFPPQLQEFVKSQIPAPQPATPVSTGVAGRFASRFN